MRATDTANSLLATMTWGRGRAGSRLWQSWAYAAAFVASVYTTARRFVSSKDNSSA